LENYLKKEIAKMDQMGNVAINTIIPVFTAFGGVLLTFWFREKQETLSALRAVKTELKHNDELGESTLHDLFSKRPSGYDKLKKLDTVPLQTSAFEHFVNSGVAVKISDDIEDSIWYHYLVIRSINRDISRRLDAPDETELLRIDDEILSGILYLSGADRLEVMKANIRENSRVEKEIAEKLERQKDLEDGGWGDVTKHTFDAIEDTLEDEIRARHPVPKYILKLVGK